MMAPSRVAEHVETAAHAARLQLLGRLAAEIAHDLNHHLTIVHQIAEAIEQETGGKAPATMADIAEEAGEIRLAAMRGASLVRRLLHFGRAAPGASGPADARIAAEEVARLARRLLGARFRIELNCASRCGHVRIDAGRLDQILLNLIVNARDAMAGGGRVVLRVRAERRRKDSRRVVFEVEDNGPGIPAAIRARMFEPHFSTRLASGASGLGLATVHAAVTESGGSIEVGDGETGGTRFVIRLPAWQGPLPPESAAASIVALPSGPVDARRGTILFVDDEVIFRRLAAGRLTRAGWRVLAAESGEEALARLASPPVPPVRAIVADFVLPGISGVELVAAVRARLGQPDLPAIIASGHPAVPSAMNLADAILRKPFRLDELTGLLDRLVPHAHATEEGYSSDH